MSLEQQLAACRVLPVVTAYDVASTVALAGALVRGGMTSIEITLRTDAALASIAAVKEALPELMVAVGTVTEVEHVHSAVAAGADLCVSPGISAELLAATATQGISYLPGVSTASEIMLGMSHGLHLFKLFPAVAVGGMNLLKALSGPFPDSRFCPTGGLNPDNFRDFLALPNVICCGGSWMVTPALVKSADWATVEQLARSAMAPQP